MGSRAGLLADKKKVLVFLGASLAPLTSYAALDAGAQLQRFQTETLRRITPPADTGLASDFQSHPSERAKTASQASIYVAAFSVIGVTQFSEKDIATVLRPFVGRELSTAEIHDAADSLNKLYRDRGYFTAKVFIPPQEVADTIRLDVYEGYLDTPGKEVVNSEERVSTDVIQGILDAQLDEGKPINRLDYERALLIVEDLPGISSHSILYPGVRVGTARLRTTISDLSLINGNIDIDNFGSRATGEQRIGATVYVNSPSKTGDQLVTRLVSAFEGGSQYGYITYLRPVSPLGTRLGVSIDYLDYDSSYINNLGYTQGNASDFRLYLTHPFVRSRHENLQIRTDLSFKSIEDTNDLGINADRDISTVTFALQGDDDHSWLGSGLTTFNAAVTIGYTDIQGNQVYIDADRATAATSGQFSKVTFNMSRLTRLSEHWSILADLNGQWTSDDLDSSQRFYLGGNGSVAGYPVGEASGDSGAEYSIELRRDFIAPWTGTLAGGLFLQQGWVRMHTSPWVNWQGGNSLLENEFTLSTVGLNLLSTIAGSWVVRGNVGWQLGSNPMRDPSTGNASDERSNDYRGWFQVIRYF